MSVGILSLWGQTEEISGLREGVQAEKVGEGVAAQSLRAWLKLKERCSEIAT